MTLYLKQTLPNDEVEIGDNSTGEEKLYVISTTEWDDIRALPYDDQRPKLMEILESHRMQADPNQDPASSDHQEQGGPEQDRGQKE